MPARIDQTQGLAPASGGSAASSGQSEPQGRVVVLWLFVGLAAATACVLLYFASIAPPAARPRIYASLAGDLALPVLAWFVFRRMNRSRDAKP